jgi:2-polyprenyl-3-methyl-5-hydroxy-6-metoxy-1,4-benzoquinol methylase
VVEAYLSNPFHKKRISQAIKLLVKYVNRNKYSSPPMVLDIAGATGIIGLKLKKVGFAPIVLDFSEEVLRVARERGLCCVCHDITEAFPFDDNSFDAIFAGEIIEHIFATDHFLSECNRVLCANGIIVLTTPNLASLDDRIKFLFGYSPRQVDTLHEYRKLHIRPFTFNMLKIVLNKKGFVILDVKSNYVRIPLTRGKKVSLSTLANIFPTLGGSLIIAAKKH